MNKLGPIFCVLLGSAGFAACGSDDPITNADIGTTLDGGDGGLGGLDVHPGEDTDGDAAADAADDAAADAADDLSTGDAAVEAGGDADDVEPDGADDVATDLPGEDAIDAADAAGDPTEDAVDAAPDAGDTSEEPDATGDEPDVAADVVVDAEPDLPAGTCGNGVVNAGEQCDDGDTVKLDGCDDECRYEQVQLLIEFDFGGGGAAPCDGEYRLNQAMTAVVQNTLENQLVAAIEAGTLNLLLALLDLDDASGGDDEALSVGVVVGVPNQDPDGPETIAEVDAWYDVPVGQLVGDEPAAQSAATLEGGTLESGPFDLAIPIAGLSAPLEDVIVSLDTDTFPMNEPDAPPELFAGDFETFEAMDGVLCGDVPAAALAEIPAPQELVDACAQEDYVLCEGDVVEDCASMLDVLQGGCTSVFAGFPITVVVPTDPDENGNYGAVFRVRTFRVHLVNNYPPAN